MVDATGKVGGAAETPSVRTGSLRLAGGASGDAPRMTLPPEPVPSSPPSEVLQAVEQVAQSLDELAERRTALHLAVGPDARLRVQVHRADSGPVRELSALHALELLATDPHELTGEGD